MTFDFHAAAVALPGMFRVGGVRVPLYGVFAVVGLLAALWLSQRTAVLAGLSADKLWDAGMVAVVAAFVASRLLLVALDFKAFVQYPLLVLALPSLTYGGIAATGFVVFGWLKWKRLPVLDVLDAWAPCAALLAAVLSLGHFLEGTEGGMPTRLPWGVHTPGDTMLGRVHPVQIYAMIAALGMCEFLLIRLKRRQRSGQVAALALMGGGALSFLLDMLRQPVESLGGAWLDPGQWIALMAMVAGAILLRVRLLPPSPPLTQIEFAEMLEKFVHGGGGDWDWETMTYEKFTDPISLHAQEQLSLVVRDYPGDLKAGVYCNEQGQQVLLDCARQLRIAAATSDGMLASTAEATNLDVDLKHG